MEPDRGPRTEAAIHEGIQTVRCAADSQVAAGGFQDAGVVRLRKCLNLFERYDTRKDNKALTFQSHGVFR